MKRKYYTGEQILEALSEVGVGAGDISEVMSCLGRMLSAEPEVRTGKWNKISDDTFHCLRCGRTFVVIQGSSLMYYCPNCGSFNGGDKG